MKRNIGRGISLFLCILFVLSSGMAFAEDVWLCDSCKYENTYSGKFCESCGAARATSEWTCTSCGQVNSRNFCENCGTAKDASSAAAAATPTATPAQTSNPEMRSDIPPRNADSLHLMVFETSIERRDIRSITLLSTLADAPADAIDVSKLCDRSVLLWFDNERDQTYDMFLGANGKIIAPTDCSGLFSYYVNCEEIHLNGCLDTSYTTNMYDMFSCCFDLLVLDGLSLNTSRVTDMSFMFSHLSEVETLDLSSFDTSATESFSYMFSSNSKLRDLDISSFTINSDARTSNMFNECTSLPESAYAHILGSIATPTPAATSTPKPTSTPYTYYPTLSRGSKSSDVRALQEQLIQLGYLASGEADGAYGRKTAEAVHRFKQVNGIADSGNHYATECEASSDMQNMLFSNSAIMAPELDFPLTFPSGSTADISKANGNKLKIRFQVTNVSVFRTVKEFTIQVYAMDTNGNKVYGNTIYYDTTVNTIKPSSYGWSTYMYLPDRDRIARVYACISEIKFNDGSTVTNPNYNYSQWDIAL